MDHTWHLNYQQWSLLVEWINELDRLSNYPLQKKFFDKNSDDKTGWDKSSPPHVNYRVKWLASYTCTKTTYVLLLGMYHSISHQLTSQFHFCNSDECRLNVKNKLVLDKFDNYIYQTIYECQVDEFR